MTGPVRSRKGEAARPGGGFEESQAVEGRQGNHGFGRRDRSFGTETNIFFPVAQRYLSQDACRDAAGAVRHRARVRAGREGCSSRNKTLSLTKYNLFRHFIYQHLQRLEMRI